MTTKHDIFNLTFKEHSVFKDKHVIVDNEDAPVLWIDKNTGHVSFGGKYFKLYNEIRLVETLMSFVDATHEYFEGDECQEYNKVEVLKNRLFKALERFEDVFEENDLVAYKNKEMYDMFYDGNAKGFKEGDIVGFKNECWNVIGELRLVDSNSGRLGFYPTEDDCIYADEEGVFMICPMEHRIDNQI